LSTARQSGKTVSLREIGWWRLHADGLFGERQNVLHTARNFAPARDTLAPVLDSIDDDDGYMPRRMTSRFQLTRLADMAEWRAIAFNAAYSMTSSMAIVDEAWDVPAAAVNEGIEPTLAEPASAQLLLVSTAHRRPSALIPHRRSTLIQTLRHPARSMICEWSAPRADDITDERTWRKASPHWSKTREGLIREVLTRALDGEGEDPNEPDPVESFRNQWLNQWPERRSSDDVGVEIFLTVEEWAESVTESGERSFKDAVLAMEDYQGQGCGAVLAQQTEDGTVVLSADVFPRWSDMLQAVSPSMVGVSTVLVGVSHFALPEVQALPARVVKRGVTETPAALALLREGVREGSVLHIPDEQLDTQIEELRVRPTTGKLGISSTKTRNDLARCAAWAVHYLRTSATPGVH
jgi:hypothetical protein